ncbi:MAG: hypothetical protein EHM45_24255 [Desulfobacteraceae bacterium]|nr:MAG: hypothetical protein EHM45_24255 [Desulfobacteraceae bacterium]
MLKSKNVLTAFQKKVLIFFSQIKDSTHFMLTGGSALAEFYLGHRKSFDLDMFTSEKELILPFSRILEEEMKKHFPVTVTRRFETFVEYEIGTEIEKIKLQLAYESPFHLESPIVCSLGVKINNYKDLTTDKFLAFFQRAEPRDAIDLFFILKQEDFGNLAQQAAQKDPGFDLYWMAVALSRVNEFPDDIDRWPVEMLLKVNVEALKKLFSDLSTKIMDDIRRLKK